MLRLAFRCSLNLVKRTKPRLVRLEITERRAFALDSNRAQTMFLGPPNFRVEQPRPLMTSKSVSAKKRSETPLVVGSGGLMPVNPWIPRPSFEQEVLRNFNRNWNAFSTKSIRPNDYMGIMIPGGIGVGKTRAGLEVPNIVAQSLKHDNKDIKLVWRLSLDYRNLHQGIAQRSNTVLDSAEIVFGLFKQALTSDKEVKNKDVATVLPITLNKLVEHFIETQSMFNKLKPSDNAVLYLHVDEFQDNPALMAVLSTEVGLYLKDQNRPNVLVILVLTGIGSKEFITQSLVTKYKMYIMNLKLSVAPEWINSLVDQFIQRIPSEKQQQIIQFREKHSTVFFKLLQTTGGIPLLIWNLLFKIKYSPTEVSPARAAQEAFEVCSKELQYLYLGGPHLTWFETKDNVMLFLKKAFFKEPVPRDYLLNGLTVGDLEESGLIYLEPVPDIFDEFTIGLPLMMLYYHNGYSKLDLLTGLNFIEYPFKTLDEAKFEDFVAQIYAFSWRLLSYQKTADVTLQYLHRGCLTASPKLLQKKITLPHADRIGVEHMTEMTKDSHGEFQLKAVNTTFKSEAPAPFVLQTHKRFPGADVLIPGKLQIQLKWSQYVGDLQTIPAAKKHNDPTYYLTTDLVEAELKKIQPDMPLVILSPKAPQEEVQNSCLNGKYPQLCLITDKKCMQFLEPFYCYSIDPTANNPVQLQAPDRRNEHTEATAATPATITKTKRGTQSPRKQKVMPEATGAATSKTKATQSPRKKTNKATTEVSTEAKH